MTVQGRPYVLVGPLAAGTSTTLTVSFLNRKNLALHFSAQAQAG